MNDIDVRVGAIKAYQHLISACSLTASARSSKKNIRNPPKCHMSGRSHQHAHHHSIVAREVFFNPHAQQTGRFKEARDAFALIEPDLDCQRAPRV